MFAKLNRKLSVMATKQYSKLSVRQKSILRFMKDYMKANGYPPTIREIGEATDINSTSVVNYNLNKLVSAGFLERSDRVSRGLRLVRDFPGYNHRTKSKAKAKVTSLDELRVPLLGKIAAGEPLEVPEDIAHNIDEDDMIEVPRALLQGSDPTNTFALRVQGDSMIDAMVRDGDIVIMKHQDTANRGDMVAVWLEERGETTLKYFYPEGKQVRLQPAHPTMDPIFVDASQCQIRGRVLSVLRQVS